VNVDYAWLVAYLKEADAGALKHSYAMNKELLLTLQHRPHLKATVELQKQELQRRGLLDEDE
jgi:hypothetical protein